MFYVREPRSPVSARVTLPRVFHTFLVYYPAHTADINFGSRITRPVLNFASGPEAVNKEQVRRNDPPEWEFEFARSLRPGSSLALDPFAPIFPLSFLHRDHHSFVYLQRVAPLIPSNASLDRRERP